MIVMPTDAPGFNLIRSAPVIGHSGGGGHCEIQYHDCRVPATNLPGLEHGDFMLAQARRGPGRTHHCMWAIGMAERAFEMMGLHPNQRETHGCIFADKQFETGIGRLIKNGNRPGSPVNSRCCMGDG